MRSEQRTQGKIKYPECALKHRPEDCWGQGPLAIVFSSSCATYGIPETLPIPENAPQQPISPYGQSKLMCEQILMHVGGASFADCTVALFQRLRRRSRWTT
jgi:hypothetical protein